MTETNNNNYYVYQHTAPNGKKYIGITQEEKPEYRWKNGKGYSKNKHFYNAINKYSWNNITHEVLAHSCPEWLAKAMERHLIAEYNTHLPEYGYNKTFGGEYNIPTEEIKQNMSDSWYMRNVGMSKSDAEKYWEDRYYNYRYKDMKYNSVDLINNKYKNTNELLYGLLGVYRFSYKVMLIILKNHSNIILTEPKEGEKITPEFIISCINSLNSYFSDYQNFKDAKALSKEIKLYEENCKAKKKYEKMTGKKYPYDMYGNKYIGKAN